MLRFASLLVTFLLLLGTAPPAVAHPMSASEMRALRVADRLMAELLVDALPEPGVDAARLRARLRHEVTSGVFVKADGDPIRCEVRVMALGDPRAQGLAAAHHIALDCPLPAAMTRLTVRASRRFGSLSVELHQPNGEPALRHVLVAGEETPPLSIAPFPRGTAAPWAGKARAGKAWTGQASVAAAAPQEPPPEAVLGVAQTIGRYLLLGFEHIVPLGLDHILFVLALFLLSPRVAPLLVQLTTFTIAHSLTLALVAAGVMSPPASVVEPLIAASIVFVGVENLRRHHLGPARLAVVAAFGLLHGMGFAGALHELGLPEGRWWLALASFNVGVELGQIAVVLAAVALTWHLRVNGEHPRWVRLPASGAIALMGLFWVVVRVLE